MKNHYTKQVSLGNPNKKFGRTRVLRKDTHHYRLHTGKNARKKAMIKRELLRASEEENSCFCFKSKRKRNIFIFDLLIFFTLLESKKKNTYHERKCIPKQIKIY